MMTEEKIQPNVFDYTNYRTYLKDLYVYFKASTPYFSYRYFSKLAGFSSPNFYKLVSEGKRNLSQDGIQKFSKALKLKGKEARHFRLLVLMDQSSSAEEKDFFTRQIFKSKTYKTLKPLSEAQYNYYEQWYHIPMRELVERSDFKNDPKWIARQFSPPLTEKQAREGLGTLVKLGFIQKENGRFKQTDKAITAGDEVTHQAFARFQQKMVELGAEALDRYSSDERDISSLTMGVSEGTFEKVRQMVIDFRREVIAVVSQDEVVDEVLQLNFQLFPLIPKNGSNDE